MAPEISITTVLNDWADIGVFAYVLPFLIIFAVVFGLLSKSKILGENKGVHVTLALAIGLISLQFDYVANFFATIFPFAGIGLSVLLVALILMGVLTEDVGESVQKWIFFGIGAVIFVIVIGYTFYDFEYFGGYFGSTDWIPTFLLIAGIVGLVVAVVKSGGKQTGGGPS